MKIKPIFTNDISSIVNIHMKSFPDSLFTKLGKKSIEKYYFWLFEGPHNSDKIGLFNDSRLIGFCFGGQFNGAVSGFVLKNISHLIISILVRPYLSFNLNLTKKINRLIKDIFPYSKKKKSLQSKSIDTDHSYAILAIAVANNFQNRGLGKKLISASEDFAKKRGYKKMHLSVSSSNNKAIQFYLNSGSNILHSNSQANVLIKNI